MLPSKRSRTPSFANEPNVSPETLESTFTVLSPEKQSVHLRATFPSLEQCWFCTKELNPGKDIFMYDDRAFCEEECRERQRINDKFMKLRQEVRAKKGKTCKNGVKEPEDCTIANLARPLSASQPDQ